MKRLLVGLTIVIFGVGLAFAQQPASTTGRGGRGAPPIQPKTEELEQIRAKSEQIEGFVNSLRSKHVDGDLLGDVEVYAKAGRMLLEFPELFGTQNAIDHSLVVLDQGIARAKQLSDGASPWNLGKKQIHAYYSAIDGSVQPYAVTLPEGYDAGKTGAALRVDARAAEQHHGIGIHFQPADVPARERAGGRPGADPTRPVRAHQRRGVALGGEADVFEGISAVREALQDRRPAHDAARLLDGRRRRVEHRAALSRSFRGGRNRRGNVVAPGADAGACSRISTPR